ncbi:MAG: LLM class flavin-dependent oxidoreductase, partial [Thermomicrobium sp.]|nr:LLM class flavin-dependent oxidoreductase [Thermomicrobium sp.]
MNQLGVGWGFAANTFLTEDETDKQLAELVSLAAIAEEARFDSVWVGDHVLWRTPVVDALTVLSAFAATTRSIKLGTAVYLLGLRQPFIAVKAITSLNALSQSRLMLGVGVGGENPAEYQACGVAVSERGKRLDAALRALKAQWTPDGDAPLARPAGARPPILIGGRSDRARRRVLRYGDAWLPAFVSPNRIREESQLLNAASEREIGIVLHAYVCTGKDHTAATEEASRYLCAVYGTSAAALMRYTFTGPAEHCAEQLQSYLEAGAVGVVLRPATWRQRHQLEDWAEHLLPALPALVAPRENA